ncbi:MAG: DUF1304 domain-containing protein [Pseudomonadota bacterium]
MARLATLLVALVAVEHIAILVLEMFYWTAPIGLKIFQMTPDVAQSSKVLAANQGLYNGFLAAGLFWSLVRGEDGRHLQVFFLTCVVVAGIFGGLTAKPSIVITQGLPAFLALIAVLMTPKPSSL